MTETLERANRFGGDWVSLLLKALSIRKADDDGLPWDDWGDEMDDLLGEYYAELAALAGEAVNPSYTMSKDAQKLSAAYIKARAAQLMDDLEDDVRALGQATAEAGLSASQIRSLLLSEFDDLSGHRANRVSRTESTRATNTGRLDAMGQQGIEKFEIVDGGTPSSCDECNTRNGMVVSAGKAQELSDTCHPHAIFAGATIRPLGRVSGAVKASWIGPGVRLIARSGARLTVSLNHPVLTHRGWLPAHLVREGDYILRSGEARRPSPGEYLHDVKATVEQIFQAIGAISRHARVAASASHLHGDGSFCQGEIEIVGTDRLLARVTDSKARQVSGERVFVRAGAALPSLPGQRSLDVRFERVVTAASRLLRRARVPSVCVAWSNRYAAFLKAVAQDRMAEAGAVRDLAKRFPAFVFLDQVSKIRDVATMARQAFDLQTATHAYFADSILVSNCTIVLVPAAPEDDIEDDDVPNEEGF